MTSFFGNLLKELKYRRQRKVLILAALVFAGGLTAVRYLWRWRSPMHVEHVTRMEAPMPAVYSAIRNTDYLARWCPTAGRVDSINEEELHITYRNRSLVIRNGESEPFHYVEKKIWDLRNDTEKLYVRWFLEPQNDTLTRIKVEMHGKLPGITGFSGSGRQARKRMRNALEALRNFLRQRKRNIRLYAYDKSLRMDSTYYIYKEYPLNGRFFRYFYDDFATMLLYAVNKQIYRASMRPFLIFYPSDTAFRYKKFRIAIPVKEIPRDMPEAYQAGKMQEAAYFGVVFNGNYDYLLENLHRSTTYLPDTVAISSSQPVLLRFKRGHSITKDPAGWQTEVLYPLAHE